MWGKLAPTSLPAREATKIAAELLLPADSVRAPRSFDELKVLARDMHVSAEVYARRCHSLNLINKDMLDNLLDQIRKGVVSARKDEFPMSPLILSKSRRGETFFSMVLDAYDSGRMDGSSVADILGVRPTRVDRR